MTTKPLFTRLLEIEKHLLYHVLIQIICSPTWRSFHIVIWSECLSCDFGATSSVLPPHALYKAFTIFTVELNHIDVFRYRVESFRAPCSRSMCQRSAKLIGGRGDRPSICLTPKLYSLMRVFLKCFWVSNGINMYQHVCQQQLFPTCTRLVPLLIPNVDGVSLNWNKMKKRSSLWRFPYEPTLEVKTEVTILQLDQN